MAPGTLHHLKDGSLDLLAGLMYSSMNWIKRKMSRKDTIWIVAGNRQEFDAYILRKHRQLQMEGAALNEYKFVFSTDQLRGLGNIKGFYIGSYKSRPDIDEIRNAIAVIKSRSVLKASTPLPDIDDLRGTNFRYFLSDSGPNLIHPVDYGPITISTNT